VKLRVGKPSPLTVTVALCVPTGVVRFGPTLNVALPFAAIPEIVIEFSVVFAGIIVFADNVKLLAPVPVNVIVSSPVFPPPVLLIRVEIAALFTLNPACVNVCVPLRLMVIPTVRITDEVRCAVPAS
jgi:hypothetical protein